MAKCKAVTRRGTPCSRPALPGSDYCAVHQPKAPPSSGDPSASVAESETAEETMIIRVGERKVKIRYLGRGSYWVAGYQFTPEAAVQEVPEKLAEFLIDSGEPFELAE